MENDESCNGGPPGDLYRLLPSLNDLLLTPEIAALLRVHSRPAVVSSARSILENTRDEVKRGLHTRTSLLLRLESLSALVAEDLQRARQYSLRPVINATGVLLHTNLGRAPLSESALEHIVTVAGGYSNLELDLDTGGRGSRDVHVESHILTLLGQSAGIDDLANSHRAIVVNNCAAATFLALHTLAKTKKVIVSRGELVEIGGGFRIPEILEESGALLKEVGTTNRTRLADYETAISPDTGLILRVHQSNFSMEGFVARPALEELILLAKRFQIPLFEDQGTGLVHSLEPCGVEGEPTLTESIRLGCDLVACSGDKLLGGPQCGILVGRKDLIRRIRENPLFRALRVDKLTYAALEATLMDYLADKYESIPIVRMLRISPQEIQTRCEQIVSQLDASGLTAEVVPVESLIGGGTAPKAKLQSYAIALRHPVIGAADLLYALRHSEPPIIGRVSEDRVLLDLRTVDANFDPALEQILHHHLPLEAVKGASG
jgi:L-seryl-tRNA(Ser) seleniumtransferase